MHQMLPAEPEWGGWSSTNMDLYMNGLTIIIIIIIIIITTTTVIVVLVTMMIINLWLFCLGGIFDMSKDDHVDKNKDDALNNKAKQYSDRNSDEDVKLSGKYLDR